MSPTNRIARFIEQVEPAPAEHPETSESRWQPAAAHGSATEPACETREPLCDDDALMVYSISRDAKDILEECIGDVFDIHGPTFEDIQSRGLSEFEIEFSGGCKVFISGLKMNTPPSELVAFLRHEAGRILEAADRLEDKFSSEW